MRHSLPPALAICACLLSLSTAVAQEDGRGDAPQPSDKVVRAARAEAERQERVRREQVSLLEEEVQYAEQFLRKVEAAEVRRGADAGDGDGPFRSAAAKRDAVARAKARVERARRKLADARTAKPAFQKIPLRAVAEIGIPAQPEFRIDTIIDDDEMIASNFPEPVWLRGFPTEGLVDDRVVTIDRPVIVSGTKRYRDRTMLLVEPYEPPPPRQPEADAAAK